MFPFRPGNGQIAGMIQSLRPITASRRFALRRPGMAAALLFLAACTAPPLPGNPASPLPSPGQPVAPVAAAPVAPAAAPLVIHNNRGGNVVQTMAWRAEIAASGRPVRITGACDSACTMLITLPNACLAPDATVGFHAPRLPGTQVIPPIVDQMMAMHYRNGIRARWFNEWRHSLAIQRITAREYVALDPMTRLCAT